jgi:hypothetical protein
MAGGTTIESRGARHVLVLTTGHEKVRVTVFLGAMVDGRKLLPLIVFKEKAPLDEGFFRSGN